jgi:tRNA pseudouridine38-40 synthase
VSLAVPEEPSRHGQPRTWKLVLQYDGTAFVGWQRQAEGESIQRLLEEALERLDGRPVKVVGAGRTDAGVHALGQVASACLAREVQPSELQRALNAMLPREIRITAAEAAPSGFHARYDARSKTYRYLVVTGDIVSPFAWRYAWHVKQPLQIDAMSRAAGALAGRHDFAAFQATGTDVKTTIRTVTSSVVTATRPGGAVVSPAWAADMPGDETAIAYEISGDGFLRHMVRNIVGTLVEIGIGRRDESSIAATLASRDRGTAGPTAPAHGLYLVRVDYS